MTENELLERCKPYESNKRVVFHSSEQYGFAKVLRKMAFYPSFLPVCAHFEHSSPPFYDGMEIVERKFLPYIFFHRQRYCDQWNKESSVKALPFQSPFVWYKNQKKLEPNKNAKGSVFFLFHSTKTVERENDHDNIIEYLKNLDESFHPISICFYYIDVQNKVYFKYMEEGFDVVTVGNKDHPDFIPRFYDLLSNYKYMTTNSIGGHVLFATDFGLPVSYFQELEPQHEYRSKEIEILRENLLKSKTYITARANFTGIQKSVSTKQKEITNEMLGIDKHTSRLKMSFILYYSFFLYILHEIKMKLR